MNYSSNYVGTFQREIDTVDNKVSLPLEWINSLKKKTLFYQKLEKKLTDNTVDVQYNFYIDKSKAYHSYKIYLTRVNSEGELLLPIDFPFFNDYKDTLIFEGHGDYFAIPLGKNKSTATKTVDSIIELFRNEEKENEEN